jgi:formate dehydrogenase subunit gamma
MEVEVKRHPIFVRVVHWSIVVSGILLGLTGLQLGGLYNFRWLEEQTYSIHVFTALIFGALWFLFLYYFIAREWKWYSLARIPYSLRFLAKETKAWFKGLPVEDPRCYDLEKKRYVEKIIPTEVAVWWIYFILALHMGFTGLSTVFPSIFGWVIGIGDALAPAFGTENGYALVKATHRLGMYLFLVVMITHVYAVILFGVLGSIITGKRKERIKS